VTMIDDSLLETRDLEKGLCAVRGKPLLTCLSRAAEHLNRFNVISLMMIFHAVRFSLNTVRSSRPLKIRIGIHP
jgi:hypothetical protein